MDSFNSLLKYNIDSVVFEHLNNTFKIRKLNFKCIIEYESLFKYNPLIVRYSNNTSIINNSFETNLYNPFNLSFIVNYYQSPRLNHYVLLEFYPYIYDYITSEPFYKLILQFREKYMYLDDLWNMWLNINPYAEHLLLTNIDEIIDLDFLSLNPKCFEIFNSLLSIKQKKQTEFSDIDFANECYLNDDLLSANPAILTYNYTYIKNKNKILKEELIKELFKPTRIHKFLQFNDDLNNYLP